MVGQAEPIDGSPMTLTQLESKEESNNFSSVRRINLVQSRNSSFSTYIRHRVKRIGEKSDEALPKHLVGLYEKSSKELDVDEKNLLRQLLIKFQDSFSKDEWDLGLTHIAEHAIDAGDAAPVKQPPRRVPLAFAYEERKAIEDLKAKGLIETMYPLGPVR